VAATDEEPEGCAEMERPVRRNRETGVKATGEGPAIAGGGNCGEKEEPSVRKRGAALLT